MLTRTLIVTFCLAPTAMPVIATNPPPRSDSFFIGIGVPPGGWSSFANAVSGDGSVVVGHFNSESAILGEAFRWTAQTGIVGLGDLGGGEHRSEAFGTSFDGGVVVGHGSVAPPPGCGFFCFPYRAFRASPNGGMNKIVNDLSTATGVSAAGDVVVGGVTIASTNAHRAFRWSGNGAGSLVYLDPLPGDDGSAAHAVSGDGSIVCGYSHIGGFGARPVRWMGTTTAQILTEAAGRARAISADGSTITGWAFDGKRNRAFRWTQGSGIAWLPDLLVGETFSIANAVSADGSVIVGYASIADGIAEIFIWDAQNGMRNLRDVLINTHHLNLTGWILRDARGISDDGRTIVGWANSPNASSEAWIAHLGDSTPVLPGDINGDGFVNVTDLLAVINAWGNCPAAPASCSADIAPPPDGNGVVNISDLLIVINGWSDGP